MKSPLIEKFGNEVRWLNWKLVPVKNERTGEIKDTKVPYQTKSKKASTIDPSTWTTYEKASANFDNGSNKFNGVGIVLHDNKLVCIDIDHVVLDGKVRSVHAPVILDLLKAANTFTEVSQSKTGLHLFLEVDEPFTPLVNKKAPYEVYADVRYIATTNDSFDKVPKDIRTVSLTELDTILKIIGYPWEKTALPKDEKKEQVVTDQPSLSDEELLRKMFNSKNGVAIQKMYNGDASEFKDDLSTADMSLLSHLAFWTRKDPDQMNRIWVSSPLGQREKTKTREDYRTRSIRNAIAKCSTVYEKPLPRVVEEEFLVVTKKEGSVVIPCQENVLIALRINSETQNKFRHNIWLDRKETLLESTEWRAVRDNDYNLVKSILARSYTHLALITASPTFVMNAIIQYCEENSVDPALEYFKNLTWDSVPRLDGWIKNTYNTVGNEEEYSIIGSQWLKALVKRVITPGCKFDNVLVLEGEQGTKKSTSLSVLGKDWHVELTTNPSDKDFFLLMKGHTIVEFSEGEIQERSSMKLLKSIITTQVDTYRAPYARETEAHPRRCVFAMTTNDSKYLKDETGNRRWLPIACVGQANIEWLEENRDQLFAEAYHRVVTLNENIYEGLSSDVIKDMQDQRREERAEESYITDWYNDLEYSKKMNGVTIPEVFQGSIKRGDVLINQFQKKIIGSILLNVLKLELKRESTGDRKYKYFPTDKTWKVVNFGEKDIFSSLQMPDLEQMRDNEKF